MTARVRTHAFESPNTTMALLFFTAAAAAAALAAAVPATGAASSSALSYVYGNTVLGELPDAAATPRPAAFRFASSQGDNMVLQMAPAQVSRDRPPALFLAGGHCVSVCARVAFAPRPGLAAAAECRLLAAT